MLRRTTSVPVWLPDGFGNEDWPRIVPPIPPENPPTSPREPVPLDYLNIFLWEYIQIESRWEDRMTGLNEERALLAELKFQLLSIRMELKFLRLVRALKAGFNPAQLRDERGRWTGGSANDSRVISDATPDDWISGAQYAGNGHHFVPRGVFSNNKYDFLPETTRAFDSETTGHLKDPSSNQYDGVHRTYNKAVEEKLDQFLERNNITSREMTPEQAKSFADEIKKSSDPRIRQLNLRIYMREIMRGLRLFRGRE
ncbi:hypothetical protein BH10PSE10_BH10PSE10_19190 [soil metagenome]